MLSRGPLLGRVCSQGEGGTPFWLAAGREEPGEFYTFFTSNWDVTTVKNHLLLIFQEEMN